MMGTNFLPICPVCHKIIIGFNQEQGKTFCPHCKNEIIITVRNKYILAILFVAAFFPLLLIRFLIDVDNISIYLHIHIFILTIIAVIYLHKNVTWEALKNHPTK
jgi:hypothetical protein